MDGGTKQFSREDRQMTNRHMKKVLNITNNEGNENKNHSERAPVRMAVIKKAKDNECQ